MKPGDKVEHIDQNIKGIVKSVHNTNVNIETEEGFEMSFPVHKLVKIGEDLDRKLLTQNIIPHKNSFQKKRVPKKAIPELDLHLEKLGGKYSHLSPGNILQFQVEEALHFLQKHKNSHHREVILIHGHGKNVLRNALLRMLREKGYEFYDASFAKYGGGALRVRVKNKG